MPTTTTKKKISNKLYWPKHARTHNSIASQKRNVKIDIGNIKNENSLFWEQNHKKRNKKNTHKN